MTSSSEESSLWNLTLRPTAATSSSAAHPATGIKLESDGNPSQLHQQFRHYGNFASISSVYADPTYENTDLLDFVCFLENRKINVTRSDSSRKSDDISSALHGNSMEVLQGTYKNLGYNDHLYPVGLKYVQESKLVDDDWKEKNKADFDRLLKVLKGTDHDQPVALKYLRRSRLPDPSWKATNRGEYYRLLEIQKNRQRDFLFECKIMAHTFLSQHRNIVKLLAVFFEDDEVLPDENNIFSPVMVVELADERFPDLDAYFSSNSRPKPITFQNATSFISDIADGLSALHSYGVIHADLKPGNILLFPDASTDNLIAKVSDFGFSAIITSNDNSRGGTTYWNAPETLEMWYISQEKINSSHSSRDVYSFGLVSMFIALDGQWPLAPEEASKAKLKDEAFGCIIAKLHKENVILSRNTDQEALFIWLAEGTLRLKAGDRWGSLAGIRVGLTGKDSNLPEITPVIPFSPMDSVTGNPDRHQLGWQYPKFPSCYKDLPLTIRRKLKAYSRTVDLDTANPVLVAQIFYLATAVLFYEEDDIEMSQLKDRASDQMKSHALLDVPDFSSRASIIRASEDPGLKSDLELYVEAGNVEPPFLKKIREDNEDLMQFDTPGIMNISICNNWGPLHYAAYFNRHAILKTLMTFNPNLEEAAGCPMDSTPLAVAAREGNFECVKILLQYGAIISPHVGSICRSPLREAIGHADDSQKYLNTVATLLEYNANIGHESWGTTPIHNATHLPKMLALFAQHNPKSLSYRDAAEMTPLHYAVRICCKESVKVLLKLGADVNAVDENGSSPLHYACRTYSKRKTPYHSTNLKKYLSTMTIGTKDDARDIINMLRNSGADIDMPMSMGRYGHDSTPDSFLYDMKVDITEESISLPNFTVSGGGLCKPNFVHVRHENSTFSYLAPTREKLSLEGMFKDVYPNQYDLVVAIGWIKSPAFHPPFLYFRISSISPIGIERSICVTPAECLSDICPQANCIYTLKGVSFEIFARKALKVTLMMRPNNDGLDMGGLVIDSVGIRRHNPVHHFDDFEFTELDVSRVTLTCQQSCELETI